MPKLDFLTLYKDLIAIPSVSCIEPGWDTSNLAVVEKLAQCLQQLGFSIELQELNAQRGKYNLLATYLPANQQTQGGLLLAGHTDTVPWDEGRWQRDPFKLTEADNKLYGLGSADMKGFFAFVIEAIQQFDLSQLQKPLRILATADEETTMAGARELNRFSDLKPDYAIIGEPTSMCPVHMHKGHATEAIRVVGKSGHSSNPAAGVNAIEVMHAAISELMTLQQQLQQRYQDDHFEVPYPTLNFGNIHGGDAANRICACCEMHIDIRPLPGMAMDDLYGLLEQRLTAVNQRYPNAVSLHHLHPAIPGYACQADSPLLSVAESISGAPPQPANYCTEAPFVQALGCHTIVMGPGSIAQAHQPDEFIRLDEIQPSLDKLGRIIGQLCF
ncbi:acetylornithine deacetylase [Idiomarina xiamenensis]|nr:acetylornithine deacetylase [Idiomarina xiamenensis]